MSHPDPLPLTGIEDLFSIGSSLPTSHHSRTMFIHPQQAMPRPLDEFQTEWIHLSYNVINVSKFFDPSFADTSLDRYGPPSGASYITSIVICKEHLLKGTNVPVGATSPSREHKCIKQTPHHQQRLPVGKPPIEMLSLHHPML